MSPHPNSLGRQKKLKSRRDIEQLFSSGAHVFSHPLKLLYQARPAETPGYQIAFAVSKKSLRKAHERNRCKRLLREAFRLQQSRLTYAGSLRLMCVYVGSTVPDQATVSTAMLRCLLKLNDTLHNTLPGQQ